ncbi:TlyA family rRNA (cytidine-2'-O)-methyltransferase [Clostridia bacterium]|nr:TlyA family rRNA (cytidine-2'-O)-methyltransferase [Clostridia bacterium]
MKQRLDIYLVENGLAPSRERARSVIMSGRVYVAGQKAEKAGDLIAAGAAVEVRGGELKYVSRGGLKLEKAVEFFDISLEGAVCMDVGASTGGFTDCMLQNGAARVYAVDVGYGQLAWTLRSDPRVVSLERTNIRFVTENEVPEPLDFATADVAFISLRLVLPVMYRLLGAGKTAVALIKPQFEAGREKVGKKGVIRDAATHREVIRDVLAFTRAVGFGVTGVTYSPIKGPEGNIEYLMYMTKDRASDTEIDIEQIVAQSHEGV